MQRLEYIPVLRHFAVFPLVEGIESAGTADGFLLFFGGDDIAQGGELLVEVTAVEPLVEHYLIDGLELGDGECLVEQMEGERFVGHLPA